MAETDKTTALDVLARAIDSSGFDRPADFEPWAAQRRLSAYDRARKYQAALAEAGLVIVPGRIFKSFPESPNKVNVREWLEARDAR
jgi:hypothetical protein